MEKVHVALYVVFFIFTFFKLTSKFVFFEMFITYFQRFYQVFKSWIYAQFWFHFHLVFLSRKSNPWISDKNLTTVFSFGLTVSGFSKLLIRKTTDNKGWLHFMSKLIFYCSPVICIYNIIAQNCMTFKKNFILFF